MIKTIRNSFVKWKVAIIGIFFVMFNFLCDCQINLVPNPSFEELTSCPANIQEICKAVPWFQPAKCPEPWGVCQCGSSDIFNFCMDPVFLGGGAPNNFAGYQIPRTDAGYSGISPFREAAPDLWREYIEVKLQEILQNQKKYCVYWYSNLANISRYGNNRIGLYFSTDTVFQTGSQYNYIPVIPQIENLEIVIDTVNWILFKQIYTAQGFEQFITIGNFRPGSMTEISGIINPDGAWSYYYFDDFGVYELPEINAGSGGEICEFGGSVQLQASCEGCWDALRYRWWPSVGLSDSTVLNPIATTGQTTTYYFGLIDTTETVSCIVDLVDSVTVTVCDGIELPVFNFFIQPNPGNTQIELVFTHIAEDTELFLYDMRGRLVMSDVVPKDAQNHVLDIQQLANAQYILKLENSEVKLRKKFVKM